MSEYIATEDVDEVLSVLIHTAEAGAASGAGTVDVGVTLLMEGAVISGTMIGASEYFEKFPNDLLTSLGITGNPDGIRESLQEAMKTILDRSRRSKNDQPEMGRYVYMKDVTIFGPGDVRVSSDLWRGRLNHVAGWSTGKLTTDPLLPSAPETPG